VGIGLGARDGDRVEGTLGKGVGLDVSPTVGLSEGAREGACEGAIRVGAGLGGGLGSGVGFLEGSSVGTSTGKGVGGGDGGCRVSPHLQISTRVLNNWHWSKGISPSKPASSSTPHGTLGCPGKAKIASGSPTHRFDPQT
jgi:hypothetical protein